MNDFPQIFANNIALGSANEVIDIHLNPEQQNPGAFTLLGEGVKNYKIKCEKGDDFLEKASIDHVHFIKIDVEGYEFEVLKGLETTIERSRPIINFEYDRAYQLKNTDDPSTIFNFLAQKDYIFFEIDGYGRKTPFTYNVSVIGAEIIAEPKRL